MNKLSKTSKKEELISSPEYKENPQTSSKSKHEKTTRHITKHEKMNLTVHPIASQENPRMKIKEKA